MPSAARGVLDVLPMKASALLGLAVLSTAIGCSAPAADDDAESTGSFLASADDEALDPNDPPNAPDPPDDPLVVDTLALQSNGAQPACAKRSPLLSPKGLTFVIHISKKAVQGKADLEHLAKIQRYLRPRDVFMVERTAPLLDKIQQLFPCNAFHFIAYPDEVDTALKTGGRIDGIALDWEGGQVEGHSVGYSVDKLTAFRKRVHADGRIAGFVPAWTPRFDDASIARASGMDYELAQIQPACVNSAKNFGLRSHAMLGEFKKRGIGLRNVGFEISLDSFSTADNHVGPDRAAGCTETAYRKGARAIYIYGNGPDHLVDYFHELGKRGVRGPR